MSVTYTCDKCGKILCLEEVYKVSISRVGVHKMPMYDLCKECSCLVRAAIDACVYERRQA